MNSLYFIIVIIPLVLSCQPHYPSSDLPPTFDLTWYDETYRGDYPYPFFNRNSACIIKPYSLVPINMTAENYKPPNIFPNTPKPTERWARKRSQLDTFLFPDIVFGPRIDPLPHKTKTQPDTPENASTHIPRTAALRMNSSDALDTPCIKCSIYVPTTIPWCPLDISIDDYNQLYNVPPNTRLMLVTYP
jgi:hypothetical protein